jgi:beta-lactam-binding protein with PASTA domain
MKTKIKTTKFDTVKVFREIKEKISLDMNGMSFEQIKEYLKANSLKLHNQ